MVSRARALAAAFALGIAVVAGPAAAGDPASPDELKAARELFNEAYKNEQDKRFAEALEKFQRVAKFRDSPSVRYRIASVLEAMGRLRDARDAFRAIGERTDLDKKDREVADSAREHAVALEKRIPKLSVRTDKPAPEGLHVTVDSDTIAVSTTATSVEVDPGEHVVRAASPGHREFATTVKLAESGEAALVLPIEDASPAPIDRPPPPPPPPADRTLGWVLAGAGALFVITGAGVLLLREQEISDVNDRCPNDKCPFGDKDVVENERDRAKLYGPVGVGLVAAGAVAGGFGAYFLLRRPPHRSSAGAVRIGTQPTRTGAILGVGGTF